MAAEEHEIQAAYKEGVLSQRLAGFDAHFSVINGSIADTARELNRLNALLAEGLAAKAERVRVHDLAAEVAAVELRMTALDNTVVRREGPIIDRISENGRRLDVLEAGLPASFLKVKDELIDEVTQLRDEISGNLLRRWAAAGSGFAVAFGVVLTLLKTLGVL